MEAMTIRGRTDSNHLGTALGARDPEGLARFYSELLGWPYRVSDQTWVTMLVPGTHTYLAFSLDELHEPPVWPSAPGQQSQQLHLDIGVRELAPAVEDAVALGARLADFQPQQDVRVLLDPEGHPFCLFLETD